jgi:RimJ/RimL family protein N-acetyltransferase
LRAFDGLPLETPRLLLRPLRAFDAEALFGIFSDPGVMRYWSTPPWSSLESARELIERDLHATARDNLRLGIERRHDGALIGTCSLYAINETCRRAEVGYALGSAAWGEGYMSEALAALLDYGFTVLNLNRVEADIDPRNEASARSLQRCGFTQEGLLRERWIVGEEVSDTAFYGLLQREWRARP